MATQIPIKVLLDGSSNTCGLAQFAAGDTVGTVDGGTGLATQGICAFAQPGINAVACKSTYIGICAGKSEGAADENTYVGYGAGQNVTTGCYHTIIGSNAGDAITTCSSSVLIGYNAGTAITFGDRNTAIGTNAGAAITTATDNTLVGYISGCVTTGNNNTGLGACVLALNTVGVDNVVIGSLAGKTQVAAGCNNTYIGSQAGEVALCRDNTLIGAYAGTAQTTATCNVMLGGCVGYGVVGGAGNVYLGYKSGLVNTSGNDNVFIGKASGVGSTASCCLIIGNGTCDIITGSFATGAVIFTDDLTVDTNTLFVDASANAVGIGALTPDYPITINQTVDNGGIKIEYNTGANANAPRFDFIKSRGSAEGSTTIVADDDELGRINWQGYDGTNPINGAYIRAFVDGTPGSNDMPTRLSFWTTADGAASPTERMTILSTGNVGIGTTTPGSILELNAAAKPELRINATGASGRNWGIMSNCGDGRFEIYDLDTAECTITMGHRSSTVLHVYGDATDGSSFMTFSNLCHSASFDIDAQGSGGDNWRVTSDLNGSLSFGNLDSSCTCVYIHCSGNVGIGTTTPGGNMEIAGSGAETDLIINNTAANGDPAIKWQLSGTTKFMLAVDDDNADVFNMIAGDSIPGNQMTSFDANKNVSIGGTGGWGSSAVGVLSIKNGTPPGSSIANFIQLYAEDVSSSSELKVRDEAGNITVLSPHDFTGIPDGPSEDLAWAYSSQRDGQRINVDMLKLARTIEKLSGEQLVYIDEVN